MADFSKVEKALKERGYTVKVFATGAEAAAYLDGEIDGATVGIGGCATAQELGLYELLEKHNTVIWHWKQEGADVRKKAMTTDFYITSANALAESGEIVNIDGVGNRVAATLFGHKKVYFIIGRNKLTADYESAVHRARNVASPRRAQQLGAKTPCAEKADRCYAARSQDALRRKGRPLLRLPRRRKNMPRHDDPLGSDDGLRSRGYTHRRRTRAVSRSLAKNCRKISGGTHAGPPVFYMPRVYVAKHSKKDSHLVMPGLTRHPDTVLKVKYKCKASHCLSTASS